MTSSEVKRDSSVMMSSVMPSLSTAGPLAA